MTAAMLCARTGIDGQFDASASYLANWLGVLKDDKKLVVSAAAEAEKAAGLISPEAQAEPQAVTGEFAGPPAPVVGKRHRELAPDRDQGRGDPVMAATSPRELQRYLVQKLEENADRIAPELREFVGGNSPGEIDVSIARVVEKTDSILESAGVRRPQPAEQARWDTDRLEGFGERAPDLNVADMDMATWAQHRKQLLRSNSDGGGIWGPGGRD